MDTYQYELVKKLSFNRPAGSREEKRAAEMLLNEIISLGGTAELEHFPFHDAIINRAAMKVAAPYEKDIDVIPYKRSLDLPEGGKEFELVYVERGTDEDLVGIQDLSGKAVLVNELKVDTYRRLCAKNAEAILVITGKHYERLLGGDFYPKMLRDKFQKYGKKSVFMIGAGDAAELIANGAEKVLLEMRQTEIENASQNVIARIKGSGSSDELIVLTAHYDSVPVGTGSWDNASGSASLMYIYRYFLEHPPLRDMCFIWCGAEEIGLLGSKAYIYHHEDEIEKIKFCFNFDMCGTILGANQIFVTGNGELETFVKQFTKHKGYSAEIKTTVHSSDSAPFADREIPSVGLSRGTPSAVIHRSQDVMSPIGAKQLNENGDFAVSMVEYIANSVIIPVSAGMPENIRKELDKYFNRD